MEITFHHSRNADFVSRIDNVEKMDDCNGSWSKKKHSKDFICLDAFCD